MKSVVLLVAYLTVAHGEPALFDGVGPIAAVFNTVTGGIGASYDAVMTQVEKGNSWATLLAAAKGTPVEGVVTSLSNFAANIDAIRSGNCSEKGTGKEFMCPIGEKCLSPGNTCTYEKCVDPKRCIYSETTYRGCKECADCYGEKKSYVCAKTDVALATTDLCHGLKAFIGTATGGGK
ncbi:uncharacterized protein LOC144822155 [Lissotriton helveticus]